MEVREEVLTLPPLWRRSEAPELVVEGEPDGLIGASPRGELVHPWR